MTERLVELPPKRILAMGRRVGLEEAAERERLAAGVSRSEIVKGMGLEEESSLIV